MCDRVTCICRSIYHGYGFSKFAVLASPTAETISARIDPLFLTRPVLLDETGAFQREGYPDERPYGFSVLVLGVVF